MKKFFSVFVSILICLGLMLTLTGCAGVYDLLNFNRKPLPNPESIVEDGLENKYQRVEDSLSKTEFSKMVEDLEDRDVYEDLLSISAPFLDSYGSYYQLGYNIELSVLDRTGIADNRPYADFTETFLFDYYGITFGTYFFKDYFYSTMVGDCFSIDAFLDENPTLSYSLLNSGGLLSFAVNAISDSFVSSFKDFNNGKEVIMVEVKEDIYEDLAVFFPSQFDIEGNYGEFKGTSRVLVEFDDEVICSVSMSLKFQNTDISLIIRDSGLAPSTDNFEFYGMAKPSYLYYLGKSFNKFNFYDYYSYFGVDTKVSVVFEDNYNKYGDLFGNQFDFYYVKNTANMYASLENEFIRVLDFGTEKIYDKTYNYYLEKNNSITTIGYDSANYSLYSDMFSGISMLFSDYFLHPQLYEADIAITENQLGFEIEIVTYYLIDFDQEGNEIFQTTITTYQLNADLTTTLSASSLIKTGDIIDFTCSLTFNYDFNLPIPSEITNYYIYK